MTDTVTTNKYITVRAVRDDSFYVNVIWFDGKKNKLGQHSYSHKRSARRAAIALAKKLDVSYRQDLEYSDGPYAFTAETMI